MARACHEMECYLPSHAYIRTLRVSAGLPMIEPTAPDIEPAQNFIHSGVFFGSVPPSICLNGS